MTERKADDGARPPTRASDDEVAARQRARERAAEETLPRKNGPAKGARASG